MACGGALWKREVGGSIRLNSNEKPFCKPPPREVQCQNCPQGREYDPFRDCHHRHIQQGPQMGPLLYVVERADLFRTLGLTNCDSNLNQAAQRRIGRSVPLYHPRASTITIPSETANCPIHCQAPGCAKFSTPIDRLARYSARSRSGSIQLCWGKLQS